MKKERDFPGCLGVRIQCFHCCRLIQSLLWELRSHICLPWPKKKKKDLKNYFKERQREHWEGVSIPGSAQWFKDLVLPRLLLRLKLQPRSDLRPGTPYATGQPKSEREMMVRSMWIIQLPASPQWLLANPPLLPFLAHLRGELYSVPFFYLLSIMTKEDSSSNTECGASVSDPITYPKSVSSRGSL